MNDRDLMQEALDALESLQAWPETPENFKRFRAIEALRARLAQPEQKPGVWTPVEIGVDVTSAGTHVVGMYVLMPDVVRHVFYSQFHPAPQREWIGLTHEEHMEILTRDLTAPSRIAVAEAKLKEKNG